MKTKPKQPEKPLMFAITYIDEKKTIPVPAAEINDLIKKEKRRYTVQNPEGLVVLKKSYKG